MIDFIARSRALARSVRGTDDSGNDWLLDEDPVQLPTAAATMPIASSTECTTHSHDVSSCPNYEEGCEVSSEEGDNQMEKARLEWTPARRGGSTDTNVTPNAHQDTPNKITPKRGEPAGVLTTTVDSSCARYLVEFITKSGYQHSNHDLSTSEGLNKVLDEISFADVVSNARERFVKQVITSAVIMIHGTTFDDYHRGSCVYGDRGLDYDAQKHVRMETAILLRGLALASLAKECGRPWMLVVPHCAPSIVDLMNLEEVKTLAGNLKPIFLNDGDHIYQVLGTSVAGCTTIATAIERTVTAGSVDQPET